MTAPIEGAPMSPKQVALSLGVTADTVRRLLGSGEMPGFKIGAQWRVTEEGPADYLLKASNQQAPKPVNLVAVMEKRLRAAGGAR